MKKLLALVSFFLFGFSFQMDAQYGQGWGGETPGARQIIIQYGDELNLTGEQKAELIARSLEQRNNRQRFGMRGDRNRPGSRKGKSPAQNDRTMERDDRYTSRTQDIYDVLTNQQTETLQSLLTERAEKEHEFRTLRNDILISKAGIEGDKAEQVTTILNRQSEFRKDMNLQRIQNSGVVNREAMREVLQNIREGQKELKTILSAAEYEKLQQAISPRHFRHRTAVKRPEWRMFRR